MTESIRLRHRSQRYAVQNG